MIRKGLRAAGAFIGSARLALVLLIFIGAWSALATAVPQGPDVSETVSAWASTNTALEPVVHALGLHEAFTAPLFVAAILLIAASTTVCAWRRTRAAAARGRYLKAAAAEGPERLDSVYDIEVALPAGADDTTALTRAAEVLAGLGIRAVEKDGAIRSVSRSWSAWGSPLFHWSLVALILAVFSGILVRSEGTMAIAVGEAKPDVAESYLTVDTGPWHDWRRLNRSIRVDAFDPAYTAGGIERGAVPTVSVLGEGGDVLVTQPVYPNMMLHSGSLSIHAPDCGLVVTLAVLSPTGAEVSRVVQLVDFSQTATEGTVPVRSMALSDAQGNVLLRMYATVPLDRDGDVFGEWIPREPSARVHMEDGQGEVLVDAIVSEGTDAQVKGGGAIRLIDIGWYSRLVLVDDPSVPFIYATMVLALLGLTLSVAAPQRAIVAAVRHDAAGGAVLRATVRLWRNNSTNRAEIERALTDALGGQAQEHAPAAPVTAEGELLP